MPKNINFLAKLNIFAMAFVILIGVYLNYDIHFENVNINTWISLVYFLMLFTCGMTNGESYFWKVLPFAVISTPNAINDLWPSEFIAGGYDVPTFSVFTHIDIYLLFGVFCFCDFNKKIRCGHFCLMFFCVLFFALTIINVFFIGVGLSLFGFFQIRYFFLLLILVLFANPYPYQQYILRSFCLCLILVVFESFIFSVLHFNDIDYRLTSGNFGVNSYGHILASGFVLLLLQRSLISNRYLWYLLCLLFFSALAATGTRFSLLVVIGGVTVLLMIKKFKWKFFLPAVVIVFCALFLFSMLSTSLTENISDIKYSLLNPDYISVTPDTSSMITRLILWNGTLNMIRDYSFLGVGPGGWAMIKNIYGISFNSVFDPHQDILNYIVMYGSPLGLWLYYYLFINPHIQVFRYREKINHLTYAWLSIITCFLIAGLSNAVTWKHQITVLVYLSSFMVSVNINQKLAINKLYPH